MKGLNVDKIIPVSGTHVHMGPVIINSTTKTPILYYTHGDTVSATTAGARTESVTATFSRFGSVVTMQFSGIESANADADSFITIAGLATGIYQPRNGTCFSILVQNNGANTRSIFALDASGNATITGNSYGQAFTSGAACAVPLFWVHYFAI